MQAPGVTYLFVPGHEERKIQRALQSGADAVILDLEDGVPEAMKDAARMAVNRVLRESTAGTRPELWVRVNGGTSWHFRIDLAQIDWPRAAGALLPKAETSSAVLLTERAGVRRVILLVESVAGLAALSQLASCTRLVERLAIGTWDLAHDLGLEGVGDPDDSEVIWHVRCQLVVDSRRFGLRPPLDGICARLEDAERLQRVCERVRSLGFGGKLLIHPAQIAPARAAFRPREEHLALARDIVAGYEEAVRGGRGAVRTRGLAVDRPMAERARATLARWSPDAHEKP